MCMAQCGGNPSRHAATKPTERDLMEVADRAGNNWIRLLTNLDIPWATIDNIRTESPTDLWEACMNGLVHWLKGGASDSNEPVTFGTLFAALEDSGMTDCVSQLVDWLDERSTPEYEDKDLSTLPSERGKELTVTNAELLQEVKMTREELIKMREELALIRRERGEARKDSLERGSLVDGEKEKDTLIAKLLEDNQRLKQASPVKPCKPEQNKGLGML